MTIKEIDVNIIWKIFVSWLKCNNIYYSFRINHYNLNDDNIRFFKMYYHNEYNIKTVSLPKYWIQYAFSWSATKEGYEFWSDKQNEWYDYYDRIKKIDINKLENTYNYGRMFIRNY